MTRPSANPKKWLLAAVKLAIVGIVLWFVGDTLLEGKAGGFSRASGDGDDDAVESTPGALNQVRVTVCDGIEGSGIYGGGFHGFSQRLIRR